MSSNTDEQQPLLADQDRSNAQEELPSANTRKSIWSWLPTIHVTEPRFRYLPLLGCLIVLVNEGEYYFKQIGYFRAIESLYCIEYYNGHDPDIAGLGRKIPENMCKLDPIQKKVATANGIVVLIRMTASFIGTMPLGYMADTIGRRFALIMHKVGTLIYIIVVLVTYLGYPAVPIWVSFLGGLGGLVGANFDLNIAVILAAYTDTMTSSSQRSTYFFITTSMQYVGQVAFPLAAGRAINIDGQGGTSEVSLFISLGMAGIGLLVSTLLFPETLKKEKRIGSEDELDGGQGSFVSEEPKSKGLTASVAAKAKSFWDSFQHTVRGLGTTNLFLLILSIFLSTMAIKAVDWLGLIQYPVIKFGWKYNQTTFALAIQAIVYIINYFILLPSYNRLGPKFGLTSSATSLLIMLLSVTFLEAGAIFLGLSSTVPQFIAATCLYTLGAGLPAVMQAYIANLVEKSGLGKLLAVMSLFQVAGKICASGIGPAIINAGIDSRNEYLKGSIFFFAAAIFMCSAISLGAVILRIGVTKQAVEQVVGEAQED